MTLQKLILSMTLFLAMQEIVGASRVELPNPENELECCKRLASMQTQIPQDRIKVWNTHVHPLIRDKFSRSQREYTPKLRVLCNSAFFLVEQGTGRVVEHNLLAGKIAISRILAPQLLDIEQTSPQPLIAQASLLVKMVIHLSGDCKIEEEKEQITQSVESDDLQATQAGDNSLSESPKTAEAAELSR